jgi:hypothetical protein
MTDLADVVSHHKNVVTQVLTNGRSCVDNAKEFMKLFTGTFDEKEAEWKFFEGQLYTLVDTLVRLTRFEGKLLEQRAAFQGADFAPIEAALEEHARSLAATPPTPAEVNSHPLMRDLLTWKQKMLDDAEVEVEDNGNKLGKCPVSQQSLDELPRTEVFRSDACVHHYSKQIFNMFRGTQQITCPVPGCKKPIQKNNIKPLA